MARGRPSRATVYRRLASAIEELTDSLGGLPSPQESEMIWADIWHLEAHHSTALEGNTLAVREVEILLDDGRAVGAKPLAEYMEVQGYGDAARWVYSHASEREDWDDGTLINLTEVRRIHELALTPVWAVAPHPQATAAEGPGGFRHHDIAQFSDGMKPPPWTEVPAMLSDWVADIAHLGSEIAGGTELDAPLPELLASIHQRFEFIHPFLDGNGRTGRLAMNLVLVRLGYPPIIIFNKQRDAYLAGLQKCDGGDAGPLGEIIARAMLDNLNRFIVPSITGPRRLVPLAALVDDRFSIAALRQAAQRDRLEAIHGPDGIWRSSKAAVDRYAANRYPRRPKPT
ncbi:MAG: Fic family protein [Actinobacteria bacterium]|jgi:Fic family protein|nr:Fic family protein [Actinomycetota bacterium]